ncbi:MAG: hypothetical protein AAFX03_11500 [Pseudomonadota bacterium]
MKLLPIHSRAAPVLAIAVAILLLWSLMARETGAEASLATIGGFALAVAAALAAGIAAVALLTAVSPRSAFRGDEPSPAFLALGLVVNVLAGAGAFIGVLRYLNLYGS